MDHHGVVLRQLRLIKKLPIKQAAKLIGRSAGWLSEVENSKGHARLFPKEFERIVSAYGGESHRKQFGIWIAQAHKAQAFIQPDSFDGAVIKYLRKKAGKPLGIAAREAGISSCYLSYLESGVRPLSKELRDKLLALYGYSPSSFKNFTTEDKRSKNIPARYKLEMLLKKMGDSQVSRVLDYAKEMGAV